jgi:hypothetical protein
VVCIRSIADVVASTTASHRNCGVILIHMYGRIITASEVASIDWSTMVIKFLKCICSNFQNGLQIDAAEKCSHVYQVLMSVSKGNFLVNEV